MFVVVRAPARYFPVDRRPLRMRPRLQPFPTDFGNGAADALHFQRDAERARYLAAKRPDRYRIARGDAEDRAHRAVLAWMEETLAGEHPGDAASPGGDFGTRYAALSDAVQEDFVVQLRDAHGRDRAIAVYVSFPSSWRPERILGWSFREIHEPVPDFADEEAQARSLVAAMVERGPYVRFVWSVCADDALDHHPDEGLRQAFSRETREAWLRIERQLTLPFPFSDPLRGSGSVPGASLFLIRTYLRAFSTLDPGERETLAIALRRLPASTARYKGIEPGLPRALALLEASGMAGPAGSA
jgi:hypothetical protein